MGFLRFILSLSFLVLTSIASTATASNVEVLFAGTAADTTKLLVLKVDTASDVSARYRILVLRPGDKTPIRLTATGSSQTRDGEFKISAWGPVYLNDYALVTIKPLTIHSTLEADGLPEVPRSFLYAGTKKLAQLAEKGFEILIEDAGLLP